MPSKYCKADLVGFHGRKIILPSVIFFFSVIMVLVMKVPKIKYKTKIELQYSLVLINSLLFLFLDGLLTLQSDADRWADTITSYQDFIRAIKTLETQYVRLTPIRNWYRILTGLVVWMTIVQIILGIPLTIPLGWDNVSKMCGKRERHTMHGCRFRLNTLFGILFVDCILSLIY